MGPAKDEAQAWCHSILSLMGFAVSGACHNLSLATVGVPMHSLLPIIERQGSSCPVSLA